MIGVAAYAAAAGGVALLLFSVLRLVMGIRVTPEEEAEGLDLAEHGMHAYDGIGSIGRTGLADELALRQPAAAALTSAGLAAPAEN